MKKLKSFDRYQYYRRAVQSPDVDCKFMSDAYKELRGKRPRLLREDFCGTFAICCSWVRRQKVNRAVGVDLDQEPIDYGRANYLSELRVDQQRRIKIVRENVMTTKVARVDIIAAFNFSFFIFKRRQDLRKYFAHARKGLKSKGLLMVDCFGGKDVQEANEERTDFRGFSYFWDQTGFDPVSNEALFHIHFKEKKRIHQMFFTNNGSLIHHQRHVLSFN